MALARIANIEVNSVLWSCTVVFIVETEEKWTKLLNELRESIADQPHLRNIDPKTEAIRLKKLTILDINGKIPYLFEGMKTEEMG